LNLNTLRAAVLLTAAAVLGCNSQPPASGTKNSARSPGKVGDVDHSDHSNGPHGGNVIDFGPYHAELTVDQTTKKATIYILDSSIKNAVPIAADKLQLSIKSPQFQVDMLADPQPGEAKGKSSRFSAVHENFGKKQEFEGTVSGVLDGKPYLGDFDVKDHKDGDKHGKHEDAPKTDDGLARERALFLTPGGIYTAADIAANGNTIPSIKYRGISWEHADDLKPGDKVCPITVNKADSKCTWIVNGKTYEFCCTPCLDKFVKWAKNEPGKIKAPEEYIQK
jgi:YHS domain-containing protein